MKVKTLVVGELSTNCHILIDDRGDCLVFDPGADSERIIGEIKNLNLGVKAVLLTHGHFDHIMAVNALKKEFNCPVIIGEPDDEMLSSDVKNAAALIGFHVDEITADQKLNDGDVIDIAGFRIKALATPGHSKGSMCYICEDMIFSGDTLFKETVGRSDLFGGNAVMLMQSLEKLKNLDGDFEVFTGHGDNTTLSHERKYNGWM